MINTLYYGDNLEILRDRDHFPNECVDLIYLDPPFNSNRSYNVLFKDESGLESEAQITAFEDTWHWGYPAQQTYHELVTEAAPGVSTAIEALRDLIGANQMMAYLVMMAARLVELHRVLKPTGSLYLHCDPTASHYLKIILDTIFGGEQFQGEIVWRRTAAHVSSRRWPRLHDIILCFAKDIQQVSFNPPRVMPDDEWIEREYRHQDERGRYMVDNLTGAGTTEGPSGQPWRGIDPKQIGAGRHWRYTPDKLDELDADGRIYWPPRGTYPKLKQYLHETGGKAVGDIWTDIPVLGRTSSERLGYPTQKPLELLERIIEASSNPGDVVLDPFCGCGTAIAAAEKLGRHWIGIDITHLSVALQKYRLQDMFGLSPGTDYQVIGEPVSVDGARQLAEDDRFQFQFWALSLIQARPLGGEAGSKKGKRGKDRGIDGVITFTEGDSGKAKRVIVQVKSGKVKSGDIRDLVGTVDREKAAMGVFITLEHPTPDMITEAASAGYYESLGWNRDYPRIQILTIDELLDGKGVDMPQQVGTFKQAQRVKEESQARTLDMFADEDLE